METQNISLVLLPKTGYHIESIYCPSVVTDEEDKKITIINK